MTPPVLSVIIPVYNAENHIQKCLDSILNQTLKNIEIIAINDYSNDSTKQILNSYGNKIVLINNEVNLGTGASRNKGLEIAAGEYIGFVDNDDWVEPDYFEKLLNKAKKENSDVCVTLKITNHTKNKNLTHTLKPKDLREIVFIKRTPPWAKILKREFVAKNQIKFDLTRGEDIFPAFLEGYKAEKISFCKDTNYHCNIRKGSVSHKKTNESDLDEIKLYEKIIDFVKNSKDEKYWLKLIKNRSLISFDFLYKTADKDMKKRVISLYKETLDAKHPLFDYYLWKICNFSEKITNILRK